MKLRQILESDIASPYDINSAATKMAGGNEDAATDIRGDLEAQNDAKQMALNRKRQIQPVIQRAQTGIKNVSQNLTQAGNAATFIGAAANAGDDVTKSLNDLGRML